MSHQHSSSTPGTHGHVPALPDDLPNAFETAEEGDELAGDDAPTAAKLAPGIIGRLRTLRAGAYLINYKPTGGPLVSYDGTLRVQAHGGGRTASGDLYQRPIVFLPPLAVPKIPKVAVPVVPRPLPVPVGALSGLKGPILAPRPLLGAGPNPAAGIPILPRNRYRYYLRVTQILEKFTFGNSFVLGYEMHRFDAATASWTNEGAFTAKMSWTTAPAGYPSPANYLTGQVKNAANAVVGTLTMGWISKYLRKATVEIDRVPQAESPLHNGAGENWRTVFEEVGWDLAVVESSAALTEPSGDSWSNAEMHAEMLARRDTSNLDAEWRYHVLAVRNLDATPRGIMYDNGGTDSNNVPREGVGISSHWMIPDDAEWGAVRNMRFGTAAMPYFRTIVHEVGHAMGLYHNAVDNGFMNTTDVIAASATPATPFPANIKWSHAPDDQKRLRHMPDVYVRPGGTPFGTSYAATPISPDDLADDAPELALEVSPLLEAVPLGAPVRVNLQLFNRGTEATVAPATISLGGGFVGGRVLGPQGGQRHFSPLQICVDDEPLTVLAPDEAVAASLTLLRGGEGALFASAGIHTIEVTVSWHVEGITRRVTGRTQVMVTPAQNDAHAAAAMKVLGTPDALLTLVFGGDHLPDGIAAIQTALDNPVLRPHFAYVEAKRQLDRFQKRRPNPAAAELIDAATVMSPDERRSLDRRLEAARSQDGAKKRPTAGGRGATPLGGELT